jgi:AraC-like DNA-binding protein
MVMRSMPDLSTPIARADFHRRAADEGAFVCARVQRAIYAPHTEQLSLKAAYGGREDYFIDGERHGVDDDVYLIINQDHLYESRLESSEPVLSVAVVFSDAMYASVLQCARVSHQRLLDMPCDTATGWWEFEEHLRPHDGAISPVLRLMVLMHEQGVREPEWYEEQTHFLLERLVARRRADREAIDSLQFARRRTREEIYRRIHRASDFILTSYRKRLTLAELAGVSCLARHHFLRMFRAVHGVTPFYFLTCKRVAVAARLLHSTSLPVSEVARASGFSGRDSLLRSFRELLQVTPARYRCTVKETARGHLPPPVTVNSLLASCAS